MKKESEFQSDFISKVKERYPQALVTKNDPTYANGFPDYSIHYGGAWALLEFKKDCKSTYRPNQKEYIDLANQMSFARAVYPQNADRVFVDLCKFIDETSGVIPGMKEPFHDPFKDRFI